MIKLPLDKLDDSKIIFYDIETDHQYAPYATLHLLGAQVGLHGKPFLAASRSERREVRTMLASPEFIKVGFNNRSFDDLVLYRSGFPVNEINCHDLYLAMKTIAPALPAYSLKFLNWYYFGDFHQPEMNLEAWAKKTGENKWKAPPPLLAPYCIHDITQTKNLFRLAWNVVLRDRHWDAYTKVELPMGLPMEEIMLRGGEYLDITRIEAEIERLENIRWRCDRDADYLTGGQVKNANSVKQVAQFGINEEGWEVILTEAGNWSIPKKELLDLRQKSPIAELMFQARKCNNALSYYRNYLKALNHDDDSRKRNWIPKQYSISRARTRRILSDSFYGINFQNANKEIKRVQMVPPGWLGGWIDSTQVENVVHIYESQDRIRRAAYESDPNWSEYVWLCNRILGTKLSKIELDDEHVYPFPANPSWSVYKGWKTIKLALNFGMGVDKYASQSGVAVDMARRSFESVHRACPAIRELSTKLQAKFRTDGFVQDPFGHIYVANPKRAYKIVAYLIQGCGTGSLPKAQLRANYDTLHQYDTLLSDPRFGPCYQPDTQRATACYGTLNGTTHDETAFRLSLDLGHERLYNTLQSLMWNMTTKFSDRFDNIPLRAKLYLSRTSAYDAKEVVLTQPSDLDLFLS